MSTNNNTKKIEQHKIGVLDFEKAVRGAQTPFNDVEWNGLTIHIRHQLTLEYMLKFVDYVTVACFKSDDGEYMPEVKDMAIRAAAIQFYTNIELPKDTMRMYKTLYGTDIISVVMSYVDAGQMNSMLIAIDKKIDYLASSNAERVTKQLELVAESFENMANNINELFGGISKDDINNMAMALGSGMIDEGKLVQALANKNLMSGAVSGEAGTTE